MNEYTIPPHAKQYIESKGKEVNRYTFVGEARRIESSSIYIIYNIGGMGG